MTTTSRRPPPTTPKGRPRRRPADAAPAAPAKAAPPKAAPPKPARKPAAKPASGTTTKGATKGATKDATKTGAKPATKTAAKTAPKAPPKAAPKTAPKTARKARSAERAAAGSRRPAARRTPSAPRTPFVLLIVGLLGGALVSLLLLNTVLAKDAFTLTRLQQSTKQLEQQRQAYEAEIAREGSPQGLSNKAKALGMKEAEDPAFFHTETGRAGDGDMRGVPDADTAAAGAAGVVGVPGTVVPGDAVPPASGGTGRAADGNP